MNSKKFLCNFCGKEWSNKLVKRDYDNGGLLDEERLKLQFIFSFYYNPSINKKTVQCGFCKSYFTTKSSMKRHMYHLCKTSHHNYKNDLIPFQNYCNIPKAPPKHYH